MPSKDDVLSPCLISLYAELQLRGIDASVYIPVQKKIILTGRNQQKM
jgi:hypothetical protein